MNHHKLFTSTFIIFLALMVGQRPVLAQTEPSATVTPPPPTIINVSDFEGDILIPPPVSTIFFELFRPEDTGLGIQTRTFSSDISEALLVIVQIDENPEDIAILRLNDVDLLDTDDFGRRLSSINGIPIRLQDTNVLEFDFDLSPNGYAAIVISPPDDTPPEAPIIDTQTFTTVSTSSVILRGSTEANALISISGGSFFTQYQLTDGATDFEVEVPLRLNAENILEIMASDMVGNDSLSTLITVLQDGTATDGSVSGQIVDAVTGAGISGARVTVEYVSGVTEENGSFSLTELPQGLAILNISADGYVDNVQRVQLASEDAVPRIYTLAPLGESVIIGTEGGSLQGTNDTSLMIPPGALAEDTLITFTQLPQSAFPAAPDPNTTFLDTVDLGLPGTTFDVPITFTFPLPILMPAGTEFQVIEIDPATGESRLLDATVNDNRLSASVQLTEFHGGAVGFGEMRTETVEGTLTRTQGPLASGGSASSATTLTGTATFTPDVSIDLINVVIDVPVQLVLDWVADILSQPKDKDVEATVPTCQRGELYAEITLKKAVVTTFVGIGFGYEVMWTKVEVTVMEDATGILKNQTPICTPTPTVTPTVTPTPTLTPIPTTCPSGVGDPKCM